MRPKKQIITLLALFFIVSIALSAYAAPGDYNLSLEATTDGNTVATTFGRGDTLYLNIVLDNSVDIAGAAFTVTYDSSKVTGPATDADGLPVNPDDVTSNFPFMSSTTKTYRANSSETNKIYLAGAAIESDGGGKNSAIETILFTIKFLVKVDAAISTNTFTLEQTQLFNLDAGYGTDNNSNGTYEEGDTKDSVPLLVSAIDNTDPNWGEDLSDDFTDETANVGPLPAVAINIVACLDSDSDNLCDSVETNTGIYVDENNTGSNPNDADSDDDSIDDDNEVANGTNPNKADTDGDGYSDLVEEQNQTDPNVQDPPDGNGYDPATDDRLAPRCDVDGDGTVQVGTDALLIIRYVFGFRGATLIDNAIGPGATRTTAAEIEAHIADAIASLEIDVDGDGSAQVGTDALLIIRYVFGFRGATLIDNAIGPGATRTTAAEIEAYILSIVD